MHAYIAIVNTSNRVSDADVSTMTAAVAHQVRYHAAPQWSTTAPPVVFHGHVNPATEPKDGSLHVPDHIPSGAYVLGIFDTDDVPDALGWHSEGDGSLVFGRVNAGVVLDNGGHALTGPLTVSSVLSHEVLEATFDPCVNRWAQDANGRLWAVEVGDPVESDWYVIEVGSDKVTVSDFVYPAWFDAGAHETARTHWLTAALAPFTVASGGYAVVWDAGGQPQQVFGDHYPDWKRETKLTPYARTAHRLDK